MSERLEITRPQPEPTHTPAFCGRYEAFNVAFAQLPVGAIVNGTVLVVHGGIDTKVTLEKLRTAPRAEYAHQATAETVQPLLQPSRCSRAAAARRAHGGP